MSRIGRKPITIPNGVEIKIENNEVMIKGPKGELSYHFHPDINITLCGDELMISRQSDNRKHRSLHGLTRSLLSNAVKGVSSGFEKNLEITGVGYRADKNGDKLVIRAGYSHSVEVVPVSGISLDVDGANRIKVTGISKELVGEMAAKIRTIHPPDSYKGKGIKYADEVVKRKPGKAGKAIGQKI